MTLRHAIQGQEEGHQQSTSQAAAVAVNTDHTLKNPVDPVEVAQAFLIAVDKAVQFRVPVMRYVVPAMHCIEAEMRFAVLEVVHIEAEMHLVVVPVLHLDTGWAVTADSDYLELLAGTDLPLDLVGMVPRSPKDGIG